TFTGATGLEPATSGVTGRDGLHRHSQRRPCVAGESRHFFLWRTGCDRVRAAATRQSLCGICVGGAVSPPTTRPRRAMAQMVSQVLMRCRWSIAAPYSRRAMIRVVVAEDAYLVREGIRRLLEPEPDIEVAAACEDLPSLLAAI